MLGVSPSSTPQEREGKAAYDRYEVRLQAVPIQGISRCGRVVRRTRGGSGRRGRGEAPKERVPVSPVWAFRGKIVQVMEFRRWRDVRVCGRTLWLHHAPREIRCPTHGRRVEEVPWAAPSARVSMGDECEGWYNGQLTFVKEVIRNAEGSVDFNAQVYDSETPRDMMVDMVMVVLPRAFGRPTDHQRCPNGTVFYASSLSDLTVDGVGIEIVITSTYSSSMSFISAVLAHEYGHAMGLPELFDRDKAPDGATDEDRHDIESGGIGNWGVMGGATGWPHPDPAKDEVSTGPNPFSVWSRAHVRWIDPVTVTSDLDIAEIEDINASSPSSPRAYKIPISEDGPEYFLVANRQNSHRWRTDTTPGSYYDGLAPSSGLAIWTLRTCGMAARTHGLLHTPIPRPMDLSLLSLMRENGIKKTRMLLPAKPRRPRCGRRSSGSWRN